MDVVKSDAANYKNFLKEFIETQNERALYGAEQIIKTFIKRNISPEEIVNLHILAFAELYPNITPEVHRAMNFLLETMISYGMALQEYQALREKQLELQSEISVAASMQETLLLTEKPCISGLDIGVISIPAQQMNGDYHHFMKGKDGSLGIAIADVIGKGVPAALCMSMIKYSVDSFPEEAMSPQMILNSLNRVVERNVDPSMFITMFYGQYHPDSEMLTYASAGHEPGFHYCAESDTFSEIKAKGLVLGVLPDTEYQQYERKINKGDMIILLTDGVTECRNGEEFIESDEVLERIHEFRHMPAQEMVEKVYRYFERMQDFHLRDDFTLLIFKKEV